MHRSLEGQISAEGQKRKKNNKIKNYFTGEKWKYFQKPFITRHVSKESFESVWSLLNLIVGHGCRMAT